jgi:hypothetical protein
VDEPEAGLEFEDGLADDGEPEVAGFDEAGVDGAYRDFVDAVALDCQEGVGAFGFGEGGRGPGVGAHGVPAAWASGSG